MERFLVDGFQPQQLSTYALTLYKHTATVDGKTILVDFWDTAGQEQFQSMHASYYHKAHACIMVFDVQRKVTYKNLSTWYAELREFRPEIPCIVVANKIDGGAIPAPGPSGLWGPIAHISLSLLPSIGNLQYLSSFWRCSLPSRDLAEPTHSLPQTQIPVNSSENVNCPTFWHGVSANPPSKPIFSLDGQTSVLLLFAADLQVTQKSFNFARKFSLPLYFVSAADGTNVVKLFNDAIRLAVSYKQNSQDFMDKVLEELENFKLEPKEEEAPDQKQSGRIKSPPHS
ncbi:rab-like protein 2B isoform X2 [Fukomys damarensis]|nr:rab-like protein 2B isoform X2 [Fukomys damarensis]